MKFLGKSRSGGFGFKMPAQRKFWITGEIFLFVLAIFLFLPPKVFAANLLQNPGFESGPSSWDNFGGEFETVSSPVHDGASAGKLSSTTNSTKWVHQVVSIVSGTAYKYSGFLIKNDSNVSSIVLRIAWYSSSDGSGSELDHTDSTSSLADDDSGYRFLSTDVVVAPNSANSVRAKVVVAFPSTNQAQAYFDDLTFEETELPSPTPTLTPTPTEVPATPTPTNTPTDTPTDAPAPNSYENIFISEFMVWQESGNEWVELFNNNDSEVNLFGWSIDDVSGGGSSPISISGTISANSYKQFYLSSAFLNNDGDDVRLLDGGQTEKDKKSFTSSTKGKSWSKDSSGDWCQADPTPNSANSDCPDSTSTLTLSPTPTLNLTPTPTPKTTPPLSATVSGEVMGEETASGDDQFKLAGAAKGLSDNSQDEVKEIKKLYQPPEKKRSILFSLIAIGGGLALIFFSVFSYLKSKQ